MPTATVRAPGSKSPLLVAAQLVATPLSSNLGSCMLWEEEGFTLYLRMARLPKMRRHVISSGFRKKTNRRNPARTFARCGNAFAEDSRVLEQLEAFGTTNGATRSARGISNCLRAQYSTSARGQEWSTGLSGWPH